MAEEFQLSQMIRLLELIFKNPPYLEKIVLLKSKMTINKDWHLANKMPKNPNMNQRINWHLEHSKNCNCRPIDGKILEEIKEIGVPTVVK